VANLRFLIEDAPEFDAIEAIGNRVPDDVGQHVRRQRLGLHLLWVIDVAGQVVLLDLFGGNRQPRECGHVQSGVSGQGGHVVLNVPVDLPSVPIVIADVQDLGGRPLAEKGRQVVLRGDGVEATARLHRDVVVLDQPLDLGQHSGRLDHEHQALRLSALRSSESRLKERLAQVARIAQVDGEPLPASNGSAEEQAPRSESQLHPAARRLLTALAQHAPARFTWGQVATLAGLKPSGGHFNAGRKELRDRALVEERDGCVAVTGLGLAEAGERAPAPSSPAERLKVWCARLPSPAPQMLRYVAAQGLRFVAADELADALAKKPTGGHWNSGIAILRAAELLRLSGGTADQASVAAVVEK
jgi:hypothetical protein